jgi:tRNA(Leu) C34 or U34 (ribose-2'-O)-methylase TrmL
MPSIPLPPGSPPSPVGVGPYAGPPLLGEHWDPALLAAGDRRNVADRYRYWRHEAIVADLDTRRHPFHVAVENWEHDFNIGSVIRSANAFNAASFHIVGKRRWNRRGAMVTDRYQHEHHHPDVASLVEWARLAPAGVASARTPGSGPLVSSAEPDGDGAGGRRTGPPGIPLIGVDNLPGSVALETYGLPRECVLVFGQEGPGLTPEMQAACEVVLHIAQFGSTRSINAGAAAAIAMHAWVRRHVFEQRP